MRIAFVLESITRTGGVMVILRLARALTDLGHDVHVISKSPQSEAVDACGSLGGIVYHSTAYAQLARRAGGRLTALQRAEVRLFTSDARKALRKIGPDLCIATENTTAFAVYEYTHQNGCHGVYYAQHDEALTNAADRRRRTVAEDSYALGLPMIANSSWLKARLLSRGCKVVACVFPAIDASVFRPPIGQRASDVIHVTSLVKPGWVKGLDIAAQAIADARQRLSPARVVWHGYGMSAAPDDFARFPDTEHHGLLTTPELASLLGESTIALSTSRLESFPLPPLEAMATGAAVVTSRIGTEDYAEDMMNACVVSDDDPLSYAAAIETLVRDEALRGRISRAGIVTSKEFSWDSHFAAAREALAA
jgi:glycosyltransferase involved in cell wall biosynthesis